MNCGSVRCQLVADSHFLHPTFPYHFRSKCITSGLPLCSYILTPPLRPLFAGEDVLVRCHSVFVTPPGSIPLACDGFPPGLAACSVPEVSCTHAHSAYHFLSPLLSSPLFFCFYSLSTLSRRASSHCISTTPISTREHLPRIFDQPVRRFPPSSVPGALPSYPVLFPWGKLLSSEVGGYFSIPSSPRTFDVRGSVRKRHVPFPLYTVLLPKSMRRDLLFFLGVRIAMQPRNVPDFQFFILVLLFPLLYLELFYS